MVDNLDSNNNDDAKRAEVILKVIEKYHAPLIVVGCKNVIAKEKREIYDLKATEIARENLRICAHTLIL